MAQIREIKKRIKSIQNTKKVTHAMELVAAAKMRKAQTAATSSRPYSQTLHQVLRTVKTKSHKKSHPLLLENKTSKQLIIVVSADRGLAGGLNINIFREILRMEIKDAEFITVGKKASEFVVKTGNSLTASYKSDEKGTIELARELSKMSIDAYVKKEVSKVTIIYQHYQSTIKQVPTWSQLLPIDITHSEQEEKNGLTTDLLFEPNADQIMETILAHHVLTQIYQVLLEAKASEHSARMVAMKNATEAAGDLVEDLTLTYNQARQEAITKELLDIITAQKAFE